MVETIRMEKVDVVKAAGRIDSHSSPELKDAFDVLLNDGRNMLVFDMSEVEFLSSSGVWVLLETQKRARRRSKGDLVLANPSENIKKTLDLAGLMHFMKIFDGVDTAVAGF